VASCGSRSGLKDFLEENAVVWHNLPVGPHSRHPDFIIVHPANGLLVLEVKDWRLESIASADKTKVELLTSRGIVRESSPLEQARKYTFEVVRTLERDGQLLFPAGHRFMGRPILPFGFGAVFTNITRKQFDQTNLKEVFAEHLCVFKDEMTEGADPEEFRSRLWRMVYPRFGEPLSMPQFDRLRALLFPEIRIRQIACLWTKRWCPIHPTGRLQSWTCIRSRSRAAWERGIELFAASLDRVRR
jgi:hypothetical protein